MRRQMNMPDDVIEILDYFSQKYAPPGVDFLTYPQTVKVMAASLEPKKFDGKR